MDWGERWLNGARSVYAPASNAEETKVEWFYEDLQDFLEHPQKMSISL